MSPVERADERLKELTGETDEQTQGGAEQQQSVEQPTDETPSQDQQQYQSTHQEDENSTTYKQRWEALKGVLNGEKAKVVQLQQQVSDLSSQMRTMQSQPQQTLSSNATQAQIADHLQSLSEEYGEDFTNALMRAVRSEASNIVNDVVGSKLQHVEQRFEQAEKESEAERRDRFASSLENMVPNWRGIYDSSPFQEWLDENSEVMSGKSYRDLFTDANNAWDMRRIASFFNTFKQATGQTSSNMDAVNSQADPRERLVVPGRSASSTPNSQAGNKKVWTMAEVNKFYRDAKDGRYSTKDADAIERDIDLANLEGRIR